MIDSYPFQDDLRDDYPAESGAMGTLGGNAYGLTAPQVPFFPRGLSGINRRERLEGIRGCYKLVKTPGSQ